MEIREGAASMSQNFLIEYCDLNLQHSLYFCINMYVPIYHQSVHLMHFYDIYKQRKFVEACKLVLGDTCIDTKSIDTLRDGIKYFGIDMLGSMTEFTH